MTGLLQESPWQKDSSISHKDIGQPNWDLEHLKKTTYNFCTNCSKVNTSIALPKMDIKCTLPLSKPYHEALLEPLTEKYEHNFNVTVLMKYRKNI